MNEPGPTKTPRPQYRTYNGEWHWYNQDLVHVWSAIAVPQVVKMHCWLCCFLTSIHLTRSYPESSALPESLYGFRVQLADSKHFWVSNYAVKGASERKACIISTRIIRLTRDMNLELGHWWGRVYAGKLSTEVEMNYVNKSPWWTLLVWNTVTVFLKWASLVIMVYCCRVRNQDFNLSSKMGTRMGGWGG